MLLLKSNQLKSKLIRLLQTRCASTSNVNNEELPTFVFANQNPNKSGSKNKSVYTWGFSSTGALGNEKLVRLERKKHQNVVKPVLVKYFNDMKVHDVACGYGFTVVAASAKDTEHKLFGTGLNNNSQIGYHLDASTREPLDRLARPTPIQLPLINKNERVLQVACGRAHTIVMTSEKQLFSLGNNAYGQCGRAFVDNEEYFPNFKVNKVEGIDEDVTEIVCGQDHTLFLTVNGRVFACGWGADGQTGLESYQNQGIPKLVEGEIKGEKIVKLSSSADAVLAINDKGDVFGWGNSEYAQFSSATNEMQLNVPRRLRFANFQKKIVDVACGGTMCGVLDENGLVYVWGYGILGKGPAVDHLSSPSLLAPELFGANEIDSNVRVKTIKAGLSQFAAITNNHDLYMWGRNRQGCLGLSHRDDQYFPFKVSLPARVKKVCLGVDHTAALTDYLL